MITHLKWDQMERVGEWASGVPAFGLMQGPPFGRPPRNSEGTTLFIIPRCSPLITARSGPRPLLVAETGLNRRRHKNPQRAPSEQSLETSSCVGSVTVGRSLIDLSVGACWISVVVHPRLGSQHITVLLAPEPSRDKSVYVYLTITERYVDLVFLFLWTNLK